MRYIVYKITNSVNNYIYIGATGKSIEARFSQHMKCKKYQHKLYVDVMTYGHEVFSVEVIETHNTKEEVSEREAFWIKYYAEHTPDMLYNIKNAKLPFVPSPEYLEMCAQIKSHLNRNQKWLAQQIGMREPLLSNKINDIEDWNQDELDAINKVLGTSFKL